MAAFTRYFSTLDVGSDTLLRLLVSNFIAGFTAAGAVQTADTGQLSSATVVRAASGSFATGYLMFAFADTLQATKPIYIRVRFKTTSTTLIAVEFQVGTATNGSGTLTGIVGIASDPSGSLSGTGAAIYPYFVAGDCGAGGTGWLSFGWAIGYTQNYAWGISRTRSNSGVANNEGAHAITIVSGLNKDRFFDFVNNTILPLSVDNTKFSTPMPNSTVITSFSFQGEVPDFPAQPARPYLDFPSLIATLHAPEDIGQGQIFSTIISGATRKYWSLGTMSSAHAVYSSPGVAIRVE